MMIHKLNPNLTLKVLKEWDSKVEVEVEYVESTCSSQCGTLTISKQELLQNWRETMTIIKLICTKKKGNKTITLNEKGNGITTTGEIYEAKNYQTYKLIDGEYVKTDKSNLLVKLIATVIFNNKLNIEEITSKFFEENTHLMKIGLIVEGNPKIVEGFHPTLQIPTKTVLIQNATLLGVEEGESLELEDDFKEKVLSARESTKERNKVGILNWLKNRFLNQTEELVKTTQKVKR